MVDDGQALEPGGQKQRALLATLLLDPNHVVSRDRLIDALWEDDPTATAVKALQVYVSQLRKLLGHDRVVTRPGGYLLRADPDELDATRFERLAGEGRPHDALALWRGPPLAEFAGQRFARAEIARLEELRLSCLEARIEADLAEGRNVVGELEALVHEQPLRERPRELLLLALYRAGRQADALAAYQDARRALVEGLGIEPGKPLRDLHQAVLRQDPALDPTATVAEPARSAFVGRENELEQLVAALDDAIAGRGRLFLLVGEPGIGKSRLADELIRVGRARRVDVLVGRAWEAGGAPAFWPWVQALRELGGEALLEVERSEDSGARVRFFDGIAEFLRNTSGERPMLLFLDDMHAADEPSVLLLEFVARELATMRVLLVVACRDAGMLAETVREPVTARLSLAGLSEEAVGAYVEAELGSRELASTLHERTDGNPLFLGETVRLLSSEGRIAIPPSLQDVIERRLARLSEGCNRVLLLAAVLGREFDHAALASMAGLSVDELLDRLDEAMTARVVSGVPGAPMRSRFAHLLIRDAIYEGLTPARRIALHRAALDVLEDDAELAFHAMAGNDLGRAAVHARRAGDRALGLVAYEEAARLYDVALAAEPDEATRCDLLLARGEAESRAGASARAKETFVEAAAAARRLGLAYELGRAALGYGGRIVWRRAGADERLVPLLEEAVTALGDDHAELRARLLARLAGALRDEHSRNRRNALSRAAVELARSTGSPAAIAYALDGRGYAILAPDTFAECLEIGSELRDAAEVAGDSERVIAGHLLRSMAQLVLGDVGAAEADRNAAMTIATKLRQPAQLSQARGDEALLALARGRFDEAERLIEETFAEGRLAQGDVADVVYHCQRYQLLEFRGRADEVERAIARVAAENPARPVLRCVLAHVHAETGLRDEAARALEELVGALPFDQEWLFGMSLLAETAALLGDGDAAAVLYRDLTPWGDLNVLDMAEGCRGSVARYLGLLAATLGRRDEAAVHFEQAIAINERMGFAPWVERTRADYDRMLGAAPA